MCNRMQQQLEEIRQIALSCFSVEFEVQRIMEILSCHVAIAVTEKSKFTFFWMHFPYVEDLHLKCARESRFALFFVGLTREYVFLGGFRWSTYEYCFAWSQFTARLVPIGYSYYPWVLLKMLLVSSSINSSMTFFQIIKLRREKYLVAIQ